MWMCVFRVSLKGAVQAILFSPSLPPPAYISACPSNLVTQAYANARLSAI